MWVPDLKVRVSLDSLRTASGPKVPVVSICKNIGGVNCIFPDLESCNSADFTLLFFSSFVFFFLRKNRIE